MRVRLVTAVLMAAALAGCHRKEKEEEHEKKLVLPLVVTFTNSGYARRTPLEDYPLQGRDGGGVKAMRLGAKAGTAVSAVLFASKGGDFECTVQGPKVDVVDGADIPLDDRTKLGASVTEPVLAACLSLGSVR